MCHVRAQEGRVSLQSPHLHGATLHLSFPFPSSTPVSDPCRFLAAPDFLGFPQAIPRYPGGAALQRSPCLSNVHCLVGSTRAIAEGTDRSTVALDFMLSCSSGQANTKGLFRTFFPQAIGYSDRGDRQQVIPKAFHSQLQALPGQESSCPAHLLNREQQRLETKAIRKKKK